MGRGKENDTEVHRRHHHHRRGPPRGPQHLRRRQPQRQARLPQGDGRRWRRYQPEQLLGAGWSSCFRGALDRAASSQGIKLSNVDVTTEISLFAEGDNFWLGAVLRAQTIDVDRATLASLMDEAHQLCPYSKATRGNIEVQLVAEAA
ncbi:Ohr family peroxiredoxin [Nocardioides immobilis]|uniref:Ohr family peroxiredoxin n=1 Tax=Nocardioides immobilis TaxID=2049295 RepID=UPI002482EAB3|nr:Ohr family peroxiredoxin [Nocardioides immobilis]